MTTDNDPIIPRKQARERYFGGISETTLWRWERDGLVPKPIRLSRCVQGWRKSTLEKLLAERQIGGDA